MTTVEPVRRHVDRVSLTCRHRLKQLDGPTQGVKRTFAAGILCMDNVDIVGLTQPSNIPRQDQVAGAGHRLTRHRDAIRIRA